MSKDLPRGIRNSNPGNLRHGPAWQGLAKVQEDKQFCQFDHHVYGIRALMKNLLTYKNKHGLKTVREAINRWAPPIGKDADGNKYTQNTSSYVSHVAHFLGVAPDEAVDWSGREMLISMTKAIVMHENGRPTNNEPFWYPHKDYETAASLAL